MKSFLRILAVLLVMNVGAGFVPRHASAQVGVSFQLFYDELSPYGSWVDYPNYGYAWIPSVGAGFSPYATSGHWVYTEYGWTWASDYGWGWAPFHYGRWYFDQMYGWIWIPDNVWGPAWVAWNSAPGYYGWAPLEPGWDIDVVTVGRVRIPPERWVFVSDRDIDRPDIEHYYGPRTDNERILRNSTVINKTYIDNSTHTKYISGPDPSEVQKRTGKQIQPVKVTQADRPGQKLSKDELVIYRPQVQKTAPGGGQPRPPKVVPMKEVKPMNERGADIPARQNNSPKNIDNQKATSPRDVTPANKQEQPQQNPPRNDNPKGNDQNKRPSPPKENNPAGNEGQQQNPVRDVNPAPANEEPHHDLNKPNDNTPQQPPRDNQQEMQKDQQTPQQPPPENPQEINKDQQSPPESPKENGGEIRNDQPPPQPPPPPPTHKRKRPKN